MVALLGWKTWWWMLNVVDVELLWKCLGVAVECRSGSRVAGQYSRSGSVALE
jgi:hypothetical protein